MRTANMENAKLDGVNSIKYHIKEMDKKNTFTRIVVELDLAEVSPNTKPVGIGFDISNFTFSILIFNSNRLVVMRKK